MSKKVCPPADGTIAFALRDGSVTGLTLTQGSMTLRLNRAD
jgi:hypothetical protein